MKTELTTAQSKAMRREVEEKIAELLEGFDALEGLGALATVMAAVIRYAFPAVNSLEVADVVNLNIKKTLRNMSDEHSRNIDCNRPVGSNGSSCIDTDTER